MDDKNLQSEYFALCPLDGRYAQIGKKLSPYFSEFALMKSRVKVEVLWLKFLIFNTGAFPILNEFDRSRIGDVLAIYENFSYASLLKIKEIEKVTNHDIKAVELFVAQKLREAGLESLVSFVHFGCTSEDINNAAYAIMISSALSDLYLPEANKLLAALSKFSQDYADIPMLAHTHGQAATPTTVGKEFAVFRFRLSAALKYIEGEDLCVKFGGATGNFSALLAAERSEDWFDLCRRFVREELKFKFNPLTTQIESYDKLCHLLDYIRHFNNVLLNLDLDMWTYISMGYFSQTAVSGEVGSSTMPHKVNPIKFENSEANAGMSNALLVALSDKLSKSRMQRDLSDSSAKRNIGLALGYSIQAISQTLSGLKTLTLNTAKLNQELESNWEVLAEPIQTILRKYGDPEAYNKLKEMTRGKNIDRGDIEKFIVSLDNLSEADRQALLNLSPSTYTGLAKFLAQSDFNDYL